MYDESAAIGCNRQMSGKRKLTGFRYIEALYVVHSDSLELFSNSGTADKFRNCLHSHDVADMVNRFYDCERRRVVNDHFNESTVNL